MAKIKTRFVCNNCGHTAAKWIGQCPDCNEWNSHDEELASKIASTPVVVQEAPRLIGDVVVDNATKVSTGASELDRVLGGGFVAGSVALLGGEPGIGKSTLLLQATAALARKGQRCLYVSAEESSAQVRMRADRLNAVVDGLWLVAETSISAILSHCDEIKPDVVVIDSIQTIFDPELSSAPGSVGQVRHLSLIHI